MSDYSKRLIELRRGNGAGQLEGPVGDEGVSKPRRELFDVRRRLHARVAQELGTILYQQQLDGDKLGRLVRDKLARLLREEQTPMSSQERNQLLTDIENDVMGHGPIEEFLRDPTV